MTHCDACAKASINPTRGLHQKDCPGCKARDLANRQETFDSMRAGKKTPEYRQSLTRVFGEGNEKAGHILVWQWVRRIKDHQKGTAA